MQTATEQRAYPVEYRRQSNRTMTGIVAHYGRVYDLRSFTETLRPGVFKKSIAESARALPLHINHDHDEVPVGRAIGWEDTDEHLIGTWEFDTRAEAVEAARQAEQGYLTGLSVGFNPLQTRWDDSGDKPHADRIEARLLETSMVSVPGYEDAGVLAVRSMGNPDVPGLQIVPTPRLHDARAWLASLKGV
jgi:HK97 family phage prohead protease